VLAIALRRLVPNLRHARPTQGGQRGRAYEFPSLAECRAYFEEKLGQPVEWLEEPDVPDPPAADPDDDIDS
jgi:hypothetical protein